MKKGLNKAMIIGNVGQDAEIKYLPNGTAVAEFTVATSETWNDKGTGEQKEKTEWHKVIAYAKLAEIIGEYGLAKKGRKVYVEGSIETQKWQAQDGSDRYTTRIKAFDLQALDSGKIGKEHHGNKADAYNDNGEYSGPETKNTPQQSSDVFEDDIPF